jgi:mRNA interferase MazF
MVRPHTPQRGDIWLAVLDPTVGSEIQKTRPCLVVSPDVMNQSLRRLTIVPLTSASHPAAFRVPVRFKSKAGLLLADQLRTIDRLRLRAKIGTLDSATLTKTLRILREMFEE